MKNSRIGLKELGAVAALAVVALGIVALATDAQAARPGPLCGPTILFECTWGNGSVHTVGLTVCELGPYEHKHHATCVASPL